MIFSLLTRSAVCRLVILSLALVWSVNVCLGQETAQEKVLSLVMQAIELQKAKDLDGAIAKFSEAIKLADKLGVLYLSRGATYMGKKDTENAMKDITKALELGLTGQSEINARRLRAIMNVDNAKYKEAVEDLDIVIASKIEDSKDFSLRGEANYKLKKPAEALPDLNKGIELDPRNERALYWRANTHTDLNNLDKAVADYTSIIAINSAGPNYYEKRAALYRRLGKIAEAEADEKKAAELRALKK